MNYRHAFHAGNHADVLKHIVLLGLIAALKRKPTPCFVLDTHAGRGRYALDADEATRTGEARAGIFRLLDAVAPPPAVDRYLQALRACNPVGELRWYPGSPLLAAQALGEHDRLACCELQPEEAIALKALFRHDARGGAPQIGVHQRDGYGAIKAMLPPGGQGEKIGRGLVLLDPPYEAQDAEYKLLGAALEEGLVRWPQGTFAAWYPIKRRRELLPFFRRLAAMPAKSALLVELQVRPDESPLRMNGSGLAILNPPWGYDADVAPALPLLTTLLGERGASHRLQWLREQ